MLSSLCVVTGNELDCGCPTPDHLASVYSARWSRALDLSRFDSEFCSTPLFIWADCDLDAFRGWRACKPFFQILICFFSLWAWKLGTICLVVSLSIFGSYLLIYSWLWPWATVHKALRQWFSGMLWPVGYMQHPEFLFSFSFLCLWTASNFILYLLSSASLFYVRSNFPYVLPIITFVWTVCNNTFRLILHSKILFLFFSFSLFQHHGLCCFDIVFILHTCCPARARIGASPKSKRECQNPIGFNMPISEHWSRCVDGPLLWTFKVKWFEEWSEVGCIDHSQMTIYGVITVGYHCNCNISDHHDMFTVNDLSNPITVPM